MALGKRTSKDDPLTEHDIAERLDRAALRVLNILMDARQLGLMDEVKGSRYNTNVCEWLAAELQHWGFEPSDPEETDASQRSSTRASTSRGRSPELTAWIEAQLANSPELSPETRAEIAQLWRSRQAPLEGS